MATTNRDWADKGWLREERDSFQLIDPQFAGALLWLALAIAMILDRYGVWQVIR